MKHFLYLLIYAIVVVLAYEFYLKKIIIKYYNIAYDWVITQWIKLKDKF